MASLQVRTNRTAWAGWILHAALIVILLPLLRLGAPAFAQTTDFFTPQPGRVATQTLDLTLDDALAIARERSFRLGRSNRNLDAAGARRAAAGAAYYPRFDSFGFLSQSQRSTFGDPLEGLRSRATGALNLSITQPIDIGGTIGRSVQQSDLSKRTAELDVVSSGLDVTFEVENAYFNALRVQGAVEVDEAIVAGLEKLHQASLKANSPNAGFLEVELANARQLLVGNRTFLDLALDNLKLVLRLPSDTTLRLMSGFGYKPESFDDAQLYRRAVENRPDLKQAETRIEQSRISVEQVEDSRKPFLTLSVFSNNFFFGRGISDAAANPNIYDHGAQLTLFAPLVYFDWGVIQANRRAAITQVNQSLADLEELKERLSSDIRQTLIALRRAEQRIRALPSRTKSVEAMNAAEQAFVTAAPAAAQAALAQMSNARANLRFAETAAIDAFADYVLAQARLKRTIAESSSTPARR